MGTGYRARARGALSWLNVGAGRGPPIRVRTLFVRTPESGSVPARGGLRAVTANLCDHPLLAPDGIGTSPVVRATSESFRNPSAGVRPGDGERLSLGVGITAARGRGDSGDAARGSAITGSAPVTSATPHDTRAPFPGGFHDSRENRSRARGSAPASGSGGSPRGAHRATGASARRWRAARARPPRGSSVRSRRPREAGTERRASHPAA